MPSVLKNLKQAGKTADMVEIRADFIRGLQPGDIKKLKPAGKITSIFTCRSVKEGGKYKGSHSEQAAIFTAAFKSGFKYIDIAGDNPFLTELKKENEKKLLLSYHNFKGTPSSIELMGRIERMQEFSPSIIKIATMVKNEKDIFTLIETLKQKREGQKLIVIGMGEAGKITRLLLPMLGSYLTYASSEDEISPGILTAEQLKAVFNLL